ncbi:hypothetical protein F7725_007438 [Dissostichus mawsoni]|uniref:Uncharacterized protein n=1 Tax=Dissostichus mawsoni TaxID=36200 RepID=A0A7J5XWT6_DISMA|nr:hypothetical protein F7725_007438 [Dissostichus mawsoni]
MISAGRKRRTGSFEEDLKKKNEEVETAMNTISSERDILNQMQSTTDMEIQCSTMKRTEWKEECRT